MAPLHAHASAGELDALLLEIEKGADVTELDEELATTPLHLASTEGHQPCVASLLQAGAKLDMRDSGGFTPLHLAIIRCHLDVVNTLLEAGADTSLTVAFAEKPQCDALQLAVLQDEPSIIALVEDAHMRRRREQRAREQQAIADHKAKKPLQNNTISASLVYMLLTFIVCWHVGVAVRMFRAHV